MSVDKLLNWFVFLKRAEAIRIRLEREKQALEQQLAMVIYNSVFNHFFLKKKKEGYIHPLFLKVREGHQNSLNLAGIAYPVEWTRLHAAENHRFVMRLRVFARLTFFRFVLG